MEQLPMASDLVQIGEAAAAAGRRRGCLVRWIRTGKLPAHRIGEKGGFLVRLADVAALAKKYGATNGGRGRPRKVVPE